MLWYVVWVLIGLDGGIASPLHYMSGPYQTVEECVTAGEKTDFPVGVATPEAPSVSIGCAQIADPDAKTT